MEDKKAAYDKEFREGVVNYKKEHPNENALFEIIDSKVLTHVNNLVPGLAQAVQTANGDECVLHLKNMFYFFTE